MLVVHGAEMLPRRAPGGGSDGYFYICCGQNSHQRRASQTDRQTAGRTDRERERDFLLELGQVWAGPKAEQWARPHQPFDVWLWEAQPFTLTNLIDICVSMGARHCRALVIWAFSWVKERSSGWNLCIPSSASAWPQSKTSWTSWSILIMISVRLSDTISHSVDIWIMNKDGWE